MGSTDNDKVLSSLDKMFAACKEGGSVTISLKRFVKPENDKWKPGSKQTKAIIEAEKKALQTDSNKKYSLMIHTKTEEDKASTEVKSNKAHSFSNSLINIFRLKCFKNPPKIQKKIKKPTQKDPNSKRTKKLKERIQLKKMRKIKKQERRLQKKLTLKDPIKKMDVESK